MLQLRLFTVLILSMPTYVFAQVGIGTNSPASSAQLEVKSTTKGFLPPRMTNSERSNISSPTAGLMVYQTDAPAGLYYHNGSAWIYIINATTDVLPVANGGTGVTTSTGTGNVVLSTSPSLTTPSLGSASATSLSTPNISTSTITAISTPGSLTYKTSASSGADHIFKVNGSTEVMRITSEGNVGIGTNSPNARLDIRSSSTSTSDPGTGYFGIGTTSTAANTAGAGAVRYSTSSGGVLEYSNGTNWNTLSSNVQKATVVAKKTTSQTINNITATNVTDWSETRDETNNFDPTTGIFTAPRTGNYVVSFSYSFTSASIAGNSSAEAILVSSGGSTNDKKSVVSFPASGTAPAGAAISFVIRLVANETVRPLIWHSLGVSRDLRVGTDANDGFVNFSVAEL